MERKRILIACEFSGIIREALTTYGYDAWSCDLLPTEIKGNHIQDDVLLHLNENWDMMIAHPPCTHLAVSGARYFKEKIKDGRQKEAIDFFMQLINAPIKYIAIENPVSIMSTVYRKPDQIIQPWQFGHEETKATCLWLKNLPKLIPTEIMVNRRNNLTISGQNKLPPSIDRWKIRSRTYPGIAKAIAEQWGEIIK